MRQPTHGTPAWGAAHSRIRKAAIQAQAHPNLTMHERDMIALVLRSPSGSEIHGAFRVRYVVAIDGDTYRDGQAFRSRDAAHRLAVRLMDRYERDDEERVTIQPAVPCRKPECKRFVAASDLGGYCATHRHPLCPPHYLRNCCREGA